MSAEVAPGIHAFVDEGLGNSAYLVEIGDRRAIAIDPPRAVWSMRALAEERGLEIAYSVETHLHADFVSGSRELAALGARVVGARSAGLDFPHHALDDGDDLDLGGLTLHAMETPGHTPEHLAYLLLDGSREVGLFSGGALIPGGVARTDLIAPDRTEPLARALWRALRARILSLPDDLRVFPTHGEGSFCSSGTGGDRTTTVGRERASNPLLQAPDEDAFVRQLLDSYGSYPTYFRRLREVNRHGPRVLGRSGLALPALDVAAFRGRIERGAELVDVRAIEAFAAGHIPGALSIALRPSFGSWLGWLVEPDRDLAFVLDEDQDRSDLVRQAAGIGYERFAGELRGGMAAWLDAGGPVRATPVATEAREVTGALVDVRQASEYVGGHVPGARSIELGALRLVGDQGRGPETMICAHGERAMTAASIAERAGRRPQAFIGGAEGWSRTARRPLVAGDGDGDGGAERAGVGATRPSSS